VGEHFSMFSVFQSLSELVSVPG